MNPALNYWDQYYESHQESEEGSSSELEPTPFLKQMRERLPVGKVLEIAMGTGTNAVYLAQQGYQVKGFDLSFVATQRALALAHRMGVSLEAKSVDLDLFLFGLFEYDVILMTYFKPSVERYYSEIIRSLKQGGMLLVESFLVEEKKEVLGSSEAYRDCYFHSNELLRHLRGLRILFYQEAQIEGRYVVQCLAQKPIDKDAQKYDFFNLHAGASKDTAKNSQRELAESLFKKK